MTTPREVTCECGTVFTAASPRARYCSARCRSRASRGGRTVARVVSMERPARAAVEVGGVLDATRDALEAAGREGTPMGRAAMALAARIDTAQDTGSAMATAVRGLDEALKAALEGSQQVGTLVSLKARRDARRNA